MEELNKIFIEYVESFKNLEIADKRHEIIQSIKEITALFEMMAAEANIKLSYLKSNEVLELKDGQESEDDFLEALLVYVENAKSVIGEYLSKVNNN